MSELPVAGHHLKKIEKNLGQIFPPSAQGNAPDDYEDFQATAVRSILNLETAANPRLRLWERIKRGYWCNTALGNQYAVQILLRQGVTVHLR